MKLIFLSNFFDPATKRQKKRESTIKLYDTSAASSAMKTKSVECENKNIFKKPKYWGLGIRTGVGLGIRIGLGIRTKASVSEQKGGHSIQIPTWINLF